MGARSATLSFDFDIASYLNGSKRVTYTRQNYDDVYTDDAGVEPSDIDGVCFSIEFERIFDITPIREGEEAGWGDGLGTDTVYTCHDIGSYPAGDSTPENFDSRYYELFGIHQDRAFDEGSDTFAKASYQRWVWWEENNELADWDAGHYELNLDGFLPDTEYANNSTVTAWSPYELNSYGSGDYWLWCGFFNEVAAQSDALYKQGVTTKTPVNSGRFIMYTDLHVKETSDYYKNCADTVKNRDLDDDALVSCSYANIQGVTLLPDFTTRSEPAAASRGSLPDATQGNLTVTGGTARKGTQARVRVNGLSDAERATIDGHSTEMSGGLNWYAYMYAEPAAGTTTDPTPIRLNGTYYGKSPFVKVLGDADSDSYYFDAMIPDDLAGGRYTISVEDADGTVRGWTDVTVSDDTGGTATYTVSFDSGGGTAVPSQTVAQGALVQRPADPTRDGYTFERWYADKNLTTPFTFASPIATDMTLYAKWSESPAPSPSVATVDVYRLYNPNSGEHLFTAAAGERDALTPLGWKAESVAWQSPETSSTPVYRLYNSHVEGGEHHYTTSAAERDSLVASGWSLDSVIPFYASDGDSGTSVYRVYNPNAFSNNHHFTTDKDEYDYLKSIGWRDEGVVFRVFRV